MTESELLSGCLANDRRTQQVLYERYCDAMYSVCLRIVKEPDMAADTLQEAFVKIFRKIDTFRQESTLGAWIKTIVVRTALSKLKKKPGFVELEEQHTKHMVDWGDFMDAEYLEKAIMSLPEGYRTVFLLIEVEGYSHQEVGDMLNISVGTSKSQLFYAKKKLRTKLAHLR